TRGMIPVATQQFLAATKAYYLPGVMAMATCLVSLYGVKLMTGDVQRVKAESFTLVFKIVGVFFFIDQAQGWYTDIVNIMSDMNGIISHAMAVAGSSGVPPCVGKPDLWQAMDCLFLVVLVAGGVSIIVSLVVIILLIVFTAGTGILIVIAFLYFMMSMFFSVVKFFQIYFMSVMAFSFVFAMGYLFVPLLMFRNTFQYFQKWMAICLAYILTPLVMYGYMGMTFIAIDYCIITGPFSVMYELCGQHAMCNFADMICPSKICLQNYKNAFWIGFEDNP